MNRLSKWAVTLTTTAALLAGTSATASAAPLQTARAQHTHLRPGAGFRLPGQAAVVLAGLRDQRLRGDPVERRQGWPAVRAKAHPGTGCGIFSWTDAELNAIGPRATARGPMSFSRFISLGGMSEIHVHQFMTLDGVADAPVWSFEYEFLPEMAATLTKVTDASKAILLGRTTYEMFEPAWSTRTVEDDPGAPFFNETKKYVVSGTLTDPTWNNSEVIGAYDPARIQQLKDEVDGNLFVSGSTTLVRAMLADGLVYSLHVFLYPLTRGEGERLLDGVPAINFTCEELQTYSHGMTYLHYRPQLIRTGCPRCATTRASRASRRRSDVAPPDVREGIPLRDVARALAVEDAGPARIHSARTSRS